MLKGIEEVYLKYDVIYLCFNKIIFSFKLKIRNVTDKMEKYFGLLRDNIFKKG